MATTSDGDGTLIMGYDLPIPYLFQFLSLFSLQIFTRPSSLPPAVTCWKQRYLNPVLVSNWTEIADVCCVLYL
jgi:hypothetical protein